MVLLRGLTFILGSLTVTLIVLLFWISFFLLPLLLTPLENSAHVVVSVSIEFLINSKQDALFHCMAYNYCCTDLNGLVDHLRDVPWEDIFKFSASLNSGFRLELMYILLIVSIRSNLTHLLGFQQLVLLP